MRPETRRGRTQWNASHRMFNVAALLLVFSFGIFVCQLVNLGTLRAKANGSESLPVSIRANSKADYSAEARPSPIPPIDENILKQLIWDLPATGAPQDRMATLRAALLSPVPTMTTDPRLPASAMQTLVPTATNVKVASVAPTLRMTFVAPTRFVYPTSTMAYTYPTYQPPAPTSTKRTRQATKTPSLTPSTAGTFTPTRTPTASATPSQTQTPTMTPGSTMTTTQTSTSTQTLTTFPTSTGTPTATQTRTATQTPSATATRTPSPTMAATPTPTFTPTPTRTDTPTATLTPSTTSTNTPTATYTATPTATQTPSNTPTLTPTYTPTMTQTPSPAATLSGGCVAYPTGEFAAANDTWVDKTSPTTSHASDTSLNIRPSAGVDQRGLVAFDLSSIPPGSTVLSAALYLTVTSGGNYTVEFYPVTQPWAETVTWDTQPTYNASSAGSFTLTTSACTRVASFSTSLVTSWVNDPSSNYGVYLFPPSGAGQATFSSREGANAPILVIDYLP